VTVICGSDELDFDDMYKAVLFAHRSGTGPYVGEDYDSLIVLGLIRNKHREETGLGLPLLFLLSMQRTSQATDARDKVYTLLGLATGISVPGDLHLIPDYSLPLTEVYTQTAPALIYAERKLGCRSWCRALYTTPPKSKPNEDLPSWVPDWTIAEYPVGSCEDPIPTNLWSPLMPIGYSDKHASCATGNSTHTPQIPDPRRTLTVRGHITDEILQRGAPLSFEDPTKLLAQIITWKALLAPQSQYLSSEAFYEAFHRTLITDTRDNSQ